MPASDVVVGDRARGKDIAKHLFGDTPEEQYKRRAHEGLAWYDVITSNNILGHANVTSDWDRDDSSVMWA